MLEEYTKMKNTMTCERIFVGFFGFFLCFRARLLFWILIEEKPYDNLYITGNRDLIPTKQSFRTNSNSWDQIVPPEQQQFHHHNHFMIVCKMTHVNKDLTHAANLCTMVSQ